MANSLQDQLLKLGLVDEQKAKQARKQKQKKVRKDRGSAEDEAAARARQALAEKAERDRKLNAERQANAGRKAVAAQIRQLIQANRLAKGDGENAYNFTDGPRIKRLYVNDEVRTQLAKGSAAVVKLHGQYDIVPIAVAEKIRERDPDCVIAVATPEPKKQDEDDPYAGYEVPDDLMW